MTPGVGRILHYRLTEADCDHINGMGRHGNGVSPGEIVPLIVTKGWSDDCVNGQAFLDGDGSLWVTSANHSHLRGGWTWPTRAEDPAEVEVGAADGLTAPEDMEVAMNAPVEMPAAGQEPDSEGNTTDDPADGPAQSEAALNAAAEAAGTPSNDGQDPEEAPPAPAPVAQPAPTTPPPPPEAVQAAPIDDPASPAFESPAMTEEEVAGMPAEDTQPDVV